jgi:hypothetical protein
LYGSTDPFESTVPGFNVGGLTYRRNLMLIHFFGRTTADPPPGGGDDSGLAGDAIRAGLTTLGVGAGDSVAGAAMGGLLFGLTQALSGLGASAFEFAARIPARAFILYGCVPSRYKSGSDFDASGSDVSIQELELEVEMMEQVGLG